ncbi:hypothetical protein HOG98_07295 [bacterium]|nr:hypothetical protein [bacterium]
MISGIGDELKAAFENISKLKPVANCPSRRSNNRGKFSSSTVLPTISEGVSFLEAPPKKNVVSEKKKIQGRRSGFYFNRPFKSLRSNKLQNVNVNKVPIDVQIRFHEWVESVDIYYFDEVVPKGTLFLVGSTNNKAVWQFETKSGKRLYYIDTALNVLPKRRGIVEVNNSLNREDMSVVPPTKDGNEPNDFVLVKGTIVSQFGMRQEGIWSYNSDAKRHVFTSGYRSTFIEIEKGVFEYSAENDDTHLISGSRVSVHRKVRETGTFKWVKKKNSSVLERGSQSESDQIFYNGEFDVNSDYDFSRLIFGKKADVFGNKYVGTFRFDEKTKGSELINGTSILMDGSYFDGKYEYNVETQEYLIVSGHHRRVDKYLAKSEKNVVYKDDVENRYVEEQIEYEKKIFSIESYGLESSLQKQKEHFLKDNIRQFKKYVSRLFRISQPNEETMSDIFYIDEIERERILEERKQEERMNPRKIVPESEDMLDIKLSEIYPIIQKRKKTADILKQERLKVNDERGGNIIEKEGYSFDGDYEYCSYTERAELVKGKLTHPKGGPSEGDFKYNADAGKLLLTKGIRKKPFHADQEGSFEYSIERKALELKKGTLSVVGGVHHDGDFEYVRELNNVYIKYGIITTKHGDTYVGTFGYVKELNGISLLNGIKSYKSGCVEDGEFRYDLDRKEMVLSK